MQDLPLENYLKDFLKGMKTPEAFEFLKLSGFSVDIVSPTSGYYHMEDRPVVTFIEKYGPQIPLGPGSWTVAKYVDSESVRVR